MASAQRAAAATDIAATADLVALTPPRTRLPPWRILAAKSLAALRDDYRAAQAATGVRWFYLAAINFIETDFGRVAGPSIAGAQGPMQFLPATWAIYGHGNIHRAQAAILAPAHLLAGHGATQNIAATLHAYNPTWLQPAAPVPAAHARPGTPPRHRHCAHSPRTHARDVRHPDQDRSIGLSRQPRLSADGQPL